MNVGVKDIVNGKQTVSVYPNPFEESLSIDITDFNGSNEYVFTLSSALGQVLDKRDLLGSSAKLNVSNLPSGVYFYEVTSNGNNVSTGRLLSK